MTGSPDPAGEKPAQARSRVRRKSHAPLIIHVPAVYLNFLSEMLMPRKQIQGKSV